TAETEARAALKTADHVVVSHIEDHDAMGDPYGPAPIQGNVIFADTVVARVALAPCPYYDPHAAQTLVDIVARELGGAIKIAMLIETSNRLATVDELTGVMNRRAFLGTIKHEHARAARYGQPLSLAMIDVDHFKDINDSHG